MGKEDRARAVLVKYHAAGNENDQVVSYEFEEIRQTIELEIAAKKTSWKTLFSTRGNRWRSLILIWCGVCKQWSGNGLISYYLGSMLKSAGITKTLDTTLITATSNMFSFACSLTFAFLPARVGRRTLMLWSMALMWLVFSIITATTGTFVETGSRSAGNATVAFIYLYNGVHNLGWTGAMMVYGEQAHRCHHCHLLVLPDLHNPQLLRSSRTVFERRAWPCSGSSPVRAAPSTPT